MKEMNEFKITHETTLYELQEFCKRKVGCHECELSAAEVQAQREYKIKRLYKRLQEFELIEKDNKKYKHICDDKSCRLVEVKE